MIGTSTIGLVLLAASATAQPEGDFTLTIPEKESPIAIAYANNAFTVRTSCGHCILDAKARLWVAADDVARRDLDSAVSISSSDDEDDVSFPVTLKDGYYGVDLVVFEERAFGDPDEPSKRTYQIVERSFPVFISVEGGSVKQVSWETFACATPPTQCTVADDGTTVINLNLPEASE